MRNRIIAVASLVLTAIVSACTPDANASVEKKNLPVICGTIDSLVAGINGTDGYTRVTLTQVKFDDGRPLTLIGTPEVSVRKGKSYSFTVADGPNRFGQYTLAKTTPIASCGEVTKTPASTVKQSEKTSSPAKMVASSGYLDYEICYKFISIVSTGEGHGNLPNLRFTGVNHRGDTSSFVWKTAAGAYSVGDRRWVMFNGRTGEPMEISNEDEGCNKLHK